MEHSVNHRNMKVLGSEYIFKIKLTCFLMDWNWEREVPCRETLILYSKSVHYINTLKKIF